MSFNINTKKKCNTQNSYSLFYCFLSCDRKTPLWLLPEFEVSELFLSLVVSDFMDGEETWTPPFTLAPSVTERLQSGQNSNDLLFSSFQEISLSLIDALLSVFKWCRWDDFYLLINLNLQLLLLLVGV